MAKGRSRAGGMGKTLFTAFWLVVIAGGLLGWARVNDIRSVGELYDYAKAWSDKANECVGEELGKTRELNCEGNGTGSGGNGTDPGGDPGDPGTDPGTEPPADPEVVKLQETIKAVKIAGTSEVNYERGDWRHWSDLDKNGCDSREDILLAQGTKIVTETNDPCDAVSGLWVSPYEGKAITDPNGIDIDHVVPLGWAAQNGGQAWSSEKKEKFANDFSQLLATSASENRSKGDKGPSEYMPDKKEYWCTYSSLWVKTLSKYDLSAPQADADKLLEGLATC